MTWSEGTLTAVLATATADSGGSNGPIVVVIVAVVTVVGTVATAFGPAMVELAKNWGRRGSHSGSGNATPPAVDPPAGGSAPAPTPTPAQGNPLVPIVGAGIDALSMVDAAIKDYRQQRDAALARVDELLRRLEEANHTVSGQLVYIAQLEGQLGYRPRGNPDPRGPRYPSGWSPQ